MPDDLKHYGRRKHDLQGMVLGMIGALGLMVLIYSVGGNEEIKFKELQCKRCHAPEEVKYHNAKEYMRFHQNRKALREQG